MDKDSLLAHEDCGQSTSSPCPKVHIGEEPFHCVVLPPSRARWGPVPE